MLAGVRTALYVPADRPAMVAKAHTRGADAVILDLEDGVAPAAKAAAREALRRTEVARPGPLVLVRVNAAPPEQPRDLDALAGRPVDGILVPKVERAEDLEPARSALASLGGTRPAVLVALLETVAAVLRLPELLAAAPDLSAVALGGEDFAADLGVARSRTGVELQLPRAWVGAWSRVYGVPCWDTPFLDLEDGEGLTADTALAAQLGFGGKLVVHPGQVAAVRAALGPESRELAHARRVVEAAARAERGAIRLDGRMVDAPVVRQAQLTLERHLRATSTRSNGEEPA